MSSLDRQEMALQDLIVTLPATTLADAAVQIALAASIASGLHGNVNTEDEAGALAEQLGHIALSVLPLVAAAAGLSMDEMGWGGLAHQRAAHFGLVGEGRS